MSDREKFYDDEIAPALLDMAKRCAERGMSMVAVVEYEPGTDEDDIGSTGETVSLQPGSGFKMRLIEAAIQAHGNADALIMALMRYATEHGHSSICLQQLGVPLMPEKRDGNTALG
jgi:hypothetical protein